MKIIKKKEKKNKITVLLSEKTWPVIVSRPELISGARANIFWVLHLTGEVLPIHPSPEYPVLQPQQFSFY
jgi:hypothetical protein